MKLKPIYPCQYHLQLGNKIHFSNRHLKRQNIKTYSFIVDFGPPAVSTDGQQESRQAFIYCSFVPISPLIVLSLVNYRFWRHVSDWVAVKDYFCVFNGAQLPGRGTTIRLQEKFTMGLFIISIQDENRCSQHLNSHKGLVFCSIMYWLQVVCYFGEMPLAFSVLSNDITDLVLSVIFSSLCIYPVSPNIFLNKDLFETGPAEHSFIEISWLKYVGQVMCFRFHVYLSYAG